MVLYNAGVVVVVSADNDEPPFLRFCRHDEGVPKNNYGA
jgi:hypothetical protein